MLFDAQWLFEHLQDFLCNGYGALFLIYLWQNKRKLVATKSCERVSLPNAALQPICDGLQQPIAYSVAESIVNPFEPVQVKEHDGQLLFISKCLIDCYAQSVFHQHPVG